MKIHQQVMGGLGGMENPSRKLLLSFISPDILTVSLCVTLGMCKAHMRWKRVRGSPF